MTKITHKAAVAFSGAQLDNSRKAMLKAIVAAYVWGAHNTATFCDVLAGKTPADWKGYKTGLEAMGANADLVRQFVTATRHASRIMLNITEDESKGLVDDKAARRSLAEQCAGIVATVGDSTVTQAVDTFLPDFLAAGLDSVSAIKAQWKAFNADPADESDESDATPAPAPTPAEAALIEEEAPAQPALDSLPVPDAIEAIAAYLSGIKAKGHADKATQGSLLTIAAFLMASASDATLHKIGRAVVEETGSRLDAQDVASKAA